MTPQRTLVVALVWAATAVGAVFMTLLAVSMTEVEVSGPWLATFMALSAVVVAFASVGAILALRRPGNVVGVVLQASGPFLVTTFCGFLLGAWFTEVNGPDDTFATVASVIASVAVSPTVIIVGPALALLFPDGRLPGRRWRWPVAAIGFVLILGTIMMMTRPGPLNVGLANNPFGISGPAWVDPVSALGLALTFLMVGAALLLAVVATAVRFRRGAGIEREQIKWFVAANTATVILLLVVTVDPALDVTWFDAVAIASLALPPIAVGIAVLRYRLYDIDRLISRGLSWAVVSGSLLAVYAAAILLLQTILGDVMGGQTVAVAGSTLLAAALFQPLRRRVQTAVDHRFNRARYDADRTATDFAERLRNETDLASVSADVAGVVDTALRPTTIGVWIRPTRPTTP